MTDVVQHIRGGTARQVAASVEAAVGAGLLAPGQSLPSVRTLARALDISPATVSQAITRLRQRGVVITRPRSGTRIAERSPVVPPAPDLPLPEGLVDLATGNPDVALLPDLRPHLDRLDLSHGRYGDPALHRGLLAVLGEDLAADGVPADHLAVTNGAMDGAERVLAVHLRHGDRVAVEDPGYTGVLSMVRAGGFQPVAVLVDDQGPLPASLEAALAGDVRAVVTSSRGQNPTGAALTPARAAELRAVLAPHPDVLVVEDDHVALVERTPLVWLAGGHPRWALLRSLNKSLGPDLRLAALTGDRETVAGVAGRQRIGPGWVSRLVQALAADMLADQGVRAGLDRAAATYSTRRSAMLAALADRGLAGRGVSGFNVWVEVADEATAVRDVAAAGFAIRGGQPYRLAAPPAVRITTATMPEGAEVEVADALARSRHTQPASTPTA